MLHTTPERLPSFCPLFAVGELHALVGIAKLKSPELRKGFLDPLSENCAASVFESRISGTSTLAR
jgi:hypothetical protein